MNSLEPLYSHDETGAVGLTICADDPGAVFCWRYKDKDWFDTDCRLSRADLSRITQALGSKKADTNYCQVGNPSVYAGRTGSGRFYLSAAGMHVELSDDELPTIESALRGYLARRETTVAFGLG